MAPKTPDETRTRAAAAEASGGSTPKAKIDDEVASLQADEVKAMLRKAKEKGLKLDGKVVTIGTGLAK
jgi:hypothetical protein